MTDSYDLVVVGTGAAGLIGAITAAKQGLRPILLEKAESWGGTSALSGGALWIPNNPLIAENGGSDSLEAALAYMEDMIHQAGPASSRARKKAFLESGPEMVKFIADAGFQWTDGRFPDYFYPENKLAHPSRSVSGVLFDGAALGPWLKTLRHPGRRPRMVMKSTDTRRLFMPLRTFGHALTAAKVMLRTAWWRATGHTPLFFGQSLVGQLMVIAQRLGVEVRLGAAVSGLLTTQGRVTGVTVAQHGESYHLAAAAGVLVCSGGFSRNSALRKRYQEVGGDYTVAIPEDTGDLLQQAMELGAATALMDDAWWAVSVLFPDGTRNLSLWERTMPYSLIVDQTGVRYADESGTYKELGRAILERNKVAPAIPSWLIMDARHRRNYVFANILGGFTPKSLINRGFFIKASSLDDLARQCAIEPGALKATITRFNDFARNGVDEDFGRGSPLFDRMLADDLVKPNPCLGPIERAPFWAVRIYPGDIGTSGGLLTDEDGRVLTEAGEVIEGLYASGNATASVMGRTYPGPGATLGPAAVFAYRAALRAASMRHRSSLAN